MREVWCETTWWQDHERRGGNLNERRKEQQWNPSNFSTRCKIAFIRTAFLFFLSPFFNFHCKMKGTEVLTCEEEKSQISNKRSMKYINNKRLPSFCGINGVIGLHLGANSMIKEINIKREDDARDWKRKRSPWNKQWVKGKELAGIFVQL